MGAPVDRNADGSPHDNPMGTAGLAFIEFSAADPAPLETLFRDLGFVQAATHAARRISLWRQNDIRFLLNADGDTQGGRFAAEHGPGVSAIAFRVADAAAALETAAAQGACACDGGAPKSVDAPALNGIGGSLLYLVDAAGEDEMLARAFPGIGGAAVVGGGFTAVDHLTHNVRAGGLEEWADFYKRLFGFREVFYLDARGSATGFRTYALMSPCNRICIPINEPSDPKSQIQEFIDQFRGEGVQHIALATEDICASVEGLPAAALAFMPIPQSYYGGVERRLPEHGQDLERLKRNAVLIDGERNPETGGWNLLLQIFSKNAVGPLFFEFIQREGNDGFGEGNARALFEAIERDQIERGVVAAAAE
ncbi:MAG: 4-hydroxyphenylpyruvate dioxygenase [Rhizomicrobium sp.]